MAHASDRSSNFHNFLAAVRPEFEGPAGGDAPSGFPARLALPRGCPSGIRSGPTTITYDHFEYKINEPWFCSRPKRVFFRGRQERSAVGSAQAPAADQHGRLPAAGTRPVKVAIVAGRPATAESPGGSGSSYFRAARVPKRGIRKSEAGDNWSFRRHPVGGEAALGRKPVGFEAATRFRDHPGRWETMPQPLYP